MFWAGSDTQAGAAIQVWQVFFKKKKRKVIFLKT